MSRYALHESLHLLRFSFIAYAGLRHLSEEKGFDDHRIRIM